jgi:hypothetical protein
MAKTEYTQKDMTGKLFKNKKKTDGDNLPLLTGNALIDGTEYRVVAWKNIPKGGGDPYFSLAFQIPQENTGKKPAPKSRKQDEDDEFML